MNYPVYIISKGRASQQLTSRALTAMNIKHSVVIEPQEQREYERGTEAKVLILPFSNLGEGSIPARNWVWEDAKKHNAKRHWILDDNIRRFFRFNKNMKIPVNTSATFAAIENFVDRYENVVMAGMQYNMFAPSRIPIPAFTLNTRIYSCILLSNEYDFYWRGRYNEDTDLSLRILKAGYCTVLFNAFLAHKTSTMTMKGGNTDELYKGDGRLKMAQSLMKQHPDVTRISRKWGRWQHQVNYRKFSRNRLKLKPGVVVPKGVNNHGMIYQEQIDGKWTDKNLSRPRSTKKAT